MSREVEIADWRRRHPCHVCGKPPTWGWVNGWALFVYACDEHRPTPPPLTSSA